MIYPNSTLQHYISATMENDMVLLSIHVDVLKKDHSEFVQTLISIGNEVRKQPGCISYQIQQDVEAQNRLTLESEWDDNDAVRFI